ncbi:MAG: hypothetical protein ACXVEE_04390 [Polyangiales bacterium]
MIGKIFITRSGYDPEHGKHVKDPYLGPQPSLGACRPDIRKVLTKGDWVFTISGKVPGIAQFVMGGFEVANKIDASDAYRRFPERRLHLLPDGQLAGNVVVDAEGHQHPLDGHKSGTFAQRTGNYLIGTNPLVVRTPPAIARARAETLDKLRSTFEHDGNSAVQIITRFGKQMSARQVYALIDWLASLTALDKSA